MTLPLREAARAVVIDPMERLLLVRFEFPRLAFWAAPGGGVEAGETQEAAIRRELYEEVGLQDVEIGPAIWTRTHVFALSSEFGGQRETFYLVRVSGEEVTPAFTEQQLRAEGVSGSRWWTLAELKGTTDERFVPKRLPELYESLLALGPPGAAVETGE